MKEGDDSVPLLRYEFITHHPTQRGNLRLNIDHDGAVRYQRNDADPPDGQSWTADLPDEPCTIVASVESRVRSILRDGGFFEMSENQVNEAATGGAVRVLEWNGPGGPRTVRVDRAKSPAFDHIVGSLSRLVGLPGM